MSSFGPAALERRNFVNATRDERIATHAFVDDLLQFVRLLLEINADLFSVAETHSAQSRVRRGVELASQGPISPRRALGIDTAAALALIAAL